MMTRTATSKPLQRVFLMNPQPRLHPSPVGIDPRTVPLISIPRVPRFTHGYDQSNAEENGPSQSGQAQAQSNDRGRFWKLNRALKSPRQMADAISQAHKDARRNQPRAHPIGRPGARTKTPRSRR